MIRKRAYLSLALLALAANLIHATSPYTGITFGSGSDTLKPTATDVSNKQSWEETAFEIKNPPYSVVGRYKPQSCTLTYYHNRLMSARCDFAREQFEAIYTNLVAQRKIPKDREFNKADKSATWYGDYKDGRFENVLNIYQSGSHTVVVYTDETQKDFRFKDLFKGMTPWLILAFVGLFVGYLAFGWLMTSKCPNCKKRKLKVTGKSFDNPEDYNPTILGTPDIHWDEVYHYKCAACGFEKDDRYSGFMSWWRSRDD